MNPVARRRHGINPYPVEQFWMGAGENAGSSPAENQYVILKAQNCCMMVAYWLAYAT